MILYCEKYFYLKYEQQRSFLKMLNFPKAAMIIFKIYTNEVRNCEIITTFFPFNSYRYG